MPQTVKSLPAARETWVWSLGQDDPLDKGMATHFSMLAWRIPWTEEPGGLQSTGSQESDSAERLHVRFLFFMVMHSHLERVEGAAPATPDPCSPSATSCKESIVVWWLSWDSSFGTPWTVARQAPLSTGLPGNNTGLLPFLLQGLFPTQGSHSGLLH